LPIRRPSISWRLSADIFGGYWTLLKAIAACYCGRHTWGATYYMRERITARSCQICKKRESA
jgi:hypothetical protein